MEQDSGHVYEIRELPTTLEAGSGYIWSRMLDPRFQIFDCFSRRFDERLTYSETVEVN